MILQALTQLYDDLASQRKIPKRGWCTNEIKLALCINYDGEVVQIVQLYEGNEKAGTKPVLGRKMTLPAAVKRSSGIMSNFLWDNSSYIFGTDDKGKPERSIDCFKACASHHKRILNGIDSKISHAILAFFEKWHPEEAERNAAFASVKEELFKGANIVFRVDGVFAQEDPKIADAWQTYYNEADGESIQCLVTGERDILETVHPSIKGVKDAQSSGAAVVSFNAPAFSSFGKEQGANAPIGKKAAFAYTTALNYLLSDKDNVQHIGDTTIVSWAKGGASQYTGLSNAFLFGSQPPDGFSESDLRAAVKRLADGKSCEQLDISPETEFYILGIAPNAARLSVRFFYRSTFGELMRNVNAHNERLDIVGLKYSFMPLWAMLRETTNLNSKDKVSNPVLSGSVARAVFTGSLYPEELIQSTMIRIRAEREITPGRAAIIKAYYIKNENSKIPKEVLQVKLNEDSSNVPYTIGRLFAVYEEAQESANPGINSTIKDRFFNSVAATPANILPLLNNLYQKHLRKMDKGAQVYFEKRVGELLTKIGDTIPMRLSIPEQGAFQLGYYHQKQKRYEKKEN